MYKNIMKRTVSLLLAFSFILSMFPMTVLAEETDTRTVITEIEATTNITAPVNGETIGKISGTITKGAPAYFWSAGIKWRKKNGNTWDYNYNGEFTPGIWKCGTQIRIDGDEGKEYRFDANNKPTVKFDGKDWTVVDVYVFPEYSYILVDSEEYYVNDGKELTFNKQSSYDIPTNFVNKAISSYSVSSSVSGGSLPYTFSKQSGPDWISVSNDGTISGTPTVAGSNSNLNIRVTDADNNYKEITINVGETQAEDERTVITEVEGTTDTDLSSKAVYGTNVVGSKLKFTVTKGSPAYFNNDMGSWQRKNGSKWENVYNGTFTDGSWRYMIQIRIDGDAGLTHKLSSTVKVKVNGSVWDTYSVYVSDSYSYVSAYSPEFTIVSDGTFSFGNSSSYNIPISNVGVPITSFSVSSTVSGGTTPYTFSKTSGPDWITVSNDGTISGTPTTTGNNSALVVRVTDNNGDYKEITITVGATVIVVPEIEATSNISSKAISGASVSTSKPAFTLTKGSPAYFNDDMGFWQKKNDSKWENVYNETLTEGSWRYKIQIRIDGEYGSTHKLSSDVTVKVDGAAWDTDSVTVMDSYSYVTAYSNEITINNESQTTHTVTFNAGTRASFDNATVNDGDAVSKPYEGEYKVDGWSITGWFTEPELENVYTFGDPVTTDLNLYAKWNGTAYIYTYDLTNDTQKTNTCGTVSMTGYSGKYYNNALGSCAENTEYTATANPAEGYKFKEWRIGSQNATSAGTESTYTFKLTDSSSIVIYAVFEEDVAPTTYTVTYDTVGGVKGANWEDTKVVDKDATWTITFPPTNVLSIPDGKEFDKVTIDGDDYSIGDTYTFTKDVIIVFVLKDKENQVSTLCSLSVKLGDGLGRISIVDEGETPTFEEPTQHAIINELTIGSKKVIAAKAEEDYRFVNWTKSGDDTFTDTNPQITIELTEDVEYLANFELIEYNVTYDANGGTGAMSSETSKYYIFPSCEFTAPSGKTFDKWEVNGKTYTAGDTLTLTEDITVKATWKNKSTLSGGGGGSSSSSYKITTKIENGTITPANTSVKKNADQEFAFKANDGYEITDVLVDGKSVGVVDSYILEKVTAKHTIEVKTAKVSALSSVDDWAKEEMAKADEKGLIPETFAKKDATKSITRLDFAAVAVKLYEAISKVKATPTQNNPFTDTNDEYVLKAYALGITKGTSETTFTPNAEITREQMATMLTRALTKAGINTEYDITNTTRFADDNELSDWGRPSVYFMAKEEIIKGIGDNRFNGLGNAKVEEAIAIALRSVEIFGK